MSAGVGRFARWDWGEREVVGEVLLLLWEGECGRRWWWGGEVVVVVEAGLGKGRSPRPGRIRLLQAHRHPGGVLLRGRGRVGGEWEVALELEVERGRREFVERMLGRGGGRWCCCSPLLW